MGWPDITRGLSEITGSTVRDYFKRDTQIRGELYGTINPLTIFDRPGSTDPVFLDLSGTLGGVDDLVLGWGKSIDQDGNEKETTREELLKWLGGDEEAVDIIMKKFDKDESGALSVNESVGLFTEVAKMGDENLFPWLGNPDNRQKWNQDYEAFVAQHSNYNSNGGRYYSRLVQIGDEPIGDPGEPRSLPYELQRVSLENEHHDFVNENHPFIGARLEGIQDGDYTFAIELQYEDTNNITPILTDAILLLEPFDFYNWVESYRS